MGLCVYCLTVQGRLWGGTLMAILLAFAGRTVHRAYQWRSVADLYKADLVVNPYHAKLWYLLALLVFPLSCSSHASLVTWLPTVYYCRKEEKEW